MAAFNVKRGEGETSFSGSPMMVVKKIGLIELPIRADHCEAAGDLPPYHRDPFDRLLIAQAQIERLVLATRDAAMRRYGLRILIV